MQSAFQQVKKLFKLVQRHETIKDGFIFADHFSWNSFIEANDMETVFEPYLKGVDLDKLRLWYNGYNFLGESVYNPFDILQFIRNKFLYRNYWFESGTPNFYYGLQE